MLRLLTFMALGLTLACRLNAFSAQTEAPRSGVIVQVRTAMRGGQPVPGARTEDKIVFRDAKVRWEERHSDRPASVTVQAEGSWTIQEGWNRSKEFGAGAGKSYPKQVRDTYALLFAKRTPEEATWNGRKCWKFAWHEEGRILGDVGMEAHDVAYWVLANPQFPLIVRSETSFGGGISNRMETRELRLDVPVAEALFQKPVGHKPIVPFTMPAGPFRVVVKRERVSHRYGWRETARETFAGARAGLTHSYAKEHTEASGTRTTFAAPEESWGDQLAQNEIQRLFQLDTGVRARGETALGLPADVLVTERGKEEKVTRWVVDHPQFGTICVKTVRETADETETVEVIELRVGR